MLLGLDGQDVRIRDTSIGNDEIRFPFRAIANAKLVLTDKLINEDLKARKGAAPDQTHSTLGD
jgi:ribosome maturation factor RimP